MTAPLIVNFAPTGMVPTRAMSPHVPLSVAEIVEDVHAAAELGITIAHLHARDAHGRPTSDPAIFAEIVAGIRRHAPELVLCLSLSGRVHPDLARRSAPLALTGALQPDMGSLTLGSVNFPHQTSINEPDVIKGLAAAMRHAGVLPELEVFNSGMLNYARHLIARDLLSPPFYVNLIVGNISTAQLDALHIAVLLRDLPPDTHWALGGIGAAQWPACQLAVALGGGVRVGLEDNLHSDAGRTRLATNAGLLRRVHDLAALAERPVMTPAEFRRLFGLAPGHGRYGLAPRSAAAASA